MEMVGETRILLANQNIPNMVGQITTVLAKDNINISELLNKHKGDYAYNIIDTEGVVDPRIVDKLKEIEGIIMARMIPLEE